MVRSLILLALVTMLVAAARSFLPQETSLVGSGATLAFGFVLVAALQAGNVLAALRLPRITGYLILGFVVGPSVLNYVTRRMLADLSIVNNVAIGLIALSAGAELNLKRVAPRLRAIVLVGLIALPIVAVLLSLCVYGLHLVPALAPMFPFMNGLSGREIVAVSIVMGVVLTSVSPMVTLAIVKELGAEGPVTDSVLGIVVLADLVIIFAFAAINAYASSTFGVTATSNVPELLIHVFGSLGLGLGVGMVFVWYGRIVQRQIALFVVTIVFLCAEAGTHLHLDPLLICLAAGLMMENVSRPTDRVLASELGPAQVPIFAVFFAAAGAKLEWHVFRDVAVLAGILAVLRGAFLWIGARLALIASRAPYSHQNLIPFGLLSQSGISIGLCMLVKKHFPGWGEGAATCLLGTVMLNELVGPVLFRGAIVRAGEAGQTAVESGSH